MKAGDEVLIRKVGNGFVVTPSPDIRHGTVIANDDVLVFQQLSSRDGVHYPESLLDWLEKHFADRP